MDMFVCGCWSIPLSLLFFDNQENDLLHVEESLIDTCTCMRCKLIKVCYFRAMVTMEQKGLCIIVRDGRVKIQVRLFNVPRSFFVCSFGFFFKYHNCRWRIVWYGHIPWHTCNNFCVLIQRSERLSLKSM
jgi:hypothetical protein